MSHIPQNLTGDPHLGAFIENLKAGVVTAEDASLAGALVAEDQGHLYADWDAPGEMDSEKRAFLEVLRLADRSYPGGIAGYIKNARVLLAEAAAG